MMRSKAVLCLMLGWMSVVSGCATNLQTAAIRQPTLGLHRYGRTIELRPIAGPVEAAQVVNSALRLAVDRQPSVTRALRVANASGDFWVEGRVTRFDYRVQEVLVETTCTVTVGTSTAVFPCQKRVLAGRALVSVEFSLGSRTHNRLIFTREYQAEPQNLLTDPNYNEHPMLANQRATRQRLLIAGLGVVVQEFARHVFFWTEPVTVELSSCHGLALCEQAQAALNRADTVQAERLLTQAIDAVPAEPVAADRSRVGDLYYNRAVVRSLLGQVRRSAMDLRRATELVPTNVEWRAKLEEHQRWIASSAANRAEIERMFESVPSANE